MKFLVSLICLLASLHFVLWGKVIASTLGTPSVSSLDTRFEKVKTQNDPWGYNSFFDDIMNFYLITKDPAYLEKLLQFGEGISSLVAKENADNNVVDAFTGEKPYAILSTDYSCGEPAAFLVHHAVEWKQLVKAATIYLALKKEKISKSAVNQIKKIMAASMFGLNYFGKDVIQDAYVTPKFPGQCSKLPKEEFYRPIPINMASAAGLLALNIKEFFSLSPVLLGVISPNYVKNSKSYVDRQTANFKYAKNSVLPYVALKNGKLVWKYMPNGRPEDTSHGGLVTPFLIKLYELKYLTSSELKGLIQTFFSTYNSAPDKVYSHIEIYPSGKNKDVRTMGDARWVQGLVRWVPLAIYDCRVYSIAHTIQNFVKPGIGQKVYASNSNQFLLEVYAPLCK